MDLKFIFFDLDGTLYNANAAYHEALHAVGVDPIGSAYTQARGKVKKILGPGHVSSHNRLLYFKVMHESQSHFSSRQLLDLHERYDAELVKQVSRQWVLLKRDFLFQELAALCPLGIITNENLRTQMLKLRAIDPDAHYFKIVIASEEVGVEKPHPKIFEEAIRRSGHSPSNCLYVGDDAEADIAGATKAGMHVIWSREFATSTASDQNVPTVHRLEALIHYLHQQKATP